MTSPETLPLCRGYVDCVRRMLRDEGWASLYRGVGVNSLKIIPGAAIQFLAYDLIKSGLLLWDPTLTGQGL